MSENVCEMSILMVDGVECRIKDGAAREGLNALETAQRSLPSAASLIGSLTPTGYVLTTDSTFLRRKTYYRLVESLEGEEYVALVRGTDYDVGDPVDQTVTYEVAGYTIAEMLAKVNALAGTVDTIIPSHRAEVAEVSE